MFSTKGEVMTDDQLYRQYLAGDQSAGDRLMLRYSDALTAYLDGFLHNAEDAEDLMLECFTVILVKKPTIAEGCFRAYLFKAARNKANRLWRMRFSRPEFSLDEEIKASDDSPEDAVWNKERNEILHKCLNRIAPQYREALWLFYFLDMSYEQSAEILGCNIKKVDNMLRNGKNRLRAEMEKEGVTYADI